MPELTGQNNDEKLTIKMIHLNSFNLSVVCIVNENDLNP